MTSDLMMSFTQAILVMIFLGFLVIELLLPPRFLPRSSIWALSPAVGAGICSLIVFAFRRPMFTVERGLLIFLFVLWIWKRRPDFPRYSQLLEWRLPVAGILIAFASMVILFLSIERIWHIPHGGTDGYAIWNSHARYLYRDGATWMQHIHNTYLPDYPLLLPALVARVWRYTQEDVPDLGGVLGLVFPFAAIAVLGTTVAIRRGTIAGVVMGFTLLTTSEYMVVAAHQEADVPLSLFVLCTVALLYLNFERESAPPGLLILAGFLAGCAAWTKNEGVLFLFAVMTALLVPVLWRPRVTLRRVALFSAGLVFPCAALLYFKFTIAPQNYLFQGRHYAELTDKILALDRYAATFKGFLKTGWTFGGWAIHPIVPLSAFFVWSGFNGAEIRSFRWLINATIVAIVLLGYYWVYMITPIELYTHIESSLNRLLFQIWPTALLLIGLAARPMPTGE